MLDVGADEDCVLRCGDGQGWWVLKRYWIFIPREMGIH